MADGSIRVAVASDDGKSVNRHFGQADRFYIYEVKDDDIHLLDIREVEPACDRQEHDDGNLEENIKTISDCRHLIVSRIGPGADLIAQRYDVESHEIPGDIRGAIEQLITTIKINKLFEV